mmetsp:Transcript_1792/g.5634  ORF Transcript_1792/g.5634 Transcript_1792/m.5634 type:complete len:280 (+) Transcript_1792:215-1054(+)
MRRQRRHARQVRGLDLASRLGNADDGCSDEEEGTAQHEQRTEAVDDVAPAFSAVRLGRVGTKAVHLEQQAHGENESRHSQRRVLQVVRCAIRKGVVQAVRNMRVRRHYKSKRDLERRTRGEEEHEGREHEFSREFDHLPHVLPGTDAIHLVKKAELLPRLRCRECPAARVQPAGDARRQAYRVHGKATEGNHGHAAPRRGEALQSHVRLQPPCALHLDAPEHAHQLHAHARVAQEPELRELGEHSRPPQALQALVRLVHVVVDGRDGERRPTTGARGAC